MAFIVTDRTHHGASVICYLRMRKPWTSVFTIGLGFMLIATEAGLLIQSSLAASPIVEITAPAPGATLTGTISVSVSAADTGTGVAGVRFQVDGVPIGAGTNTSPYTFSLDTTKFANGAHSLTAS